MLPLLQPGLGQLYGGRPGRVLLAPGLTVLPLLLLFGGAAATFPLLVAVLALALVLYLGILMDAFLLARRTTGFQLRWYNCGYVYIGLFVLFGLGWRPLLQVVVRVADLPARSYSIPSGGIEPTLQSGDYIVVGRTGAPRRGDIVLFEVEGRTAIKRIAAVAGDEVEIRAKRLFVNGRPVEEPWAQHSDPMTYPNAPLIDPTPRKRDNLPPHARSCRARLRPEGTTVTTATTAASTGRSRSRICGAGRSMSTGRGTVAGSGRRSEGRARRRGGLPRRAGAPPRRPAGGGEGFSGSLPGTVLQLGGQV